MGHLELSLPSPNRKHSGHEISPPSPNREHSGYGKNIAPLSIDVRPCTGMLREENWKDLTSIPLFRKFEACSGSPGNVIILLREQFSGLNRSGDSEKLANWLNLTVNTVNAFSGIIGASVSLVCLTLFELVWSVIWTLMFIFRHSHPRR